MISEEHNRRLTRVGPGEPAGEMLRRYWHPVAALDDLARNPVKAVRLLGEDLVAYRDLGGAYGLLARHCAHRGADLSYGYVEQCGLRCNYHGWLYGESGACLHQPFEETFDPRARLRERTHVTAYPVRALAGLLWAYLGPLPAPELPDWEPFSWKNGFVQIVFADVPCNWLQCQENSIDPVHFEWMHSNWSKRLRNEPGPYAPAHTRLDFEEFDYGIVYKRVREDTDEQHPLWTVGRTCLWPNAFFLGDHFEWRVPVDDENTLSVTWSFWRVPREREPYVQEAIPSWTSPIRDAASGRWISSHVINQDIIAWAGQGRIADRTRENLGASDQGIWLLRKRLAADIDCVARGEDPSGLIRDAQANHAVRLPVAMRKTLTEGMPLEAYLAHPMWGKHIRHFPFHAGQPEAVKRAYESAMGVTMTDRAVVDL
ncbi:MAG: aromatic ring-hydroxylating dioxygenase subunit alpha [Betaproteobacteria bacterium]|nr:aromatic ring-hydroxylating dioxygenase subunit alpha [Betaproteobacteria bacterium]